MMVFEKGPKINWDTLPDDAWLFDHQLAHCPYIGGSPTKPLHCVTMSRRRSAGKAVKYKRLGNRILTRMGDVRAYFEALNEVRQSCAPPHAAGDRQVGEAQCQR